MDITHESKQRVYLMFPCEPTNINLPIRSHHITSGVRAGVSRVQAHAEAVAQAALPLAGVDLPRLTRQGALPVPLPVLPLPLVHLGRPPVHPRQAPRWGTPPPHPRPTVEV